MANPIITIRCPDALLARLDAALPVLEGEYPHVKMSRAAAIRILIDEGTRRRSVAAFGKAAEQAAAKIDALAKREGGE